MKSCNVIGLMSGTSLDGLDIACCRFEPAGEGWTYTILRAATLPYSSAWENRLRNVENSTALGLALAHSDYGHYLGECVNAFLAQGSEHVDLIASHGHTIFHQPDKKLTFQLGSGAAIAAVTGIPVACDFRTGDVALGGQGAPLVPIGDDMLFGNYTYCLNIGGIANVSYRDADKRLAWDICAANMVLNDLSAAAGQKFDNGGAMARSGKFIPQMADALDALSFYNESPPKSLGKEWVLQQVFPIVNMYKADLADCMHTYVKHIAKQIGRVMQSGNCLITGGGAYNTFLIECIRENTAAKIETGSPQLIEYKEALVFALLGLLRINGKPNALASVTGASRDNSGGAIYSL
jgi:anhydro-N-acetylmuramic acid kinase